MTEPAAKIKSVCLECGATNQFPADASGKTVRCGRCKSGLPEPGAVLEPAPRQFAALIRSSALTVLADFSSRTCMPCRMMEPILAGLARRRSGDLVVVRIDTDDQRDLAASFRIKAVPTFIVFRQGYEVGRTQGAMNETDFSLWVASKG